MLTENVGGIPSVITSGNGSGDGMMGGSFLWIIVLLFLFAGKDGFGGGNNTGTNDTVWTAQNFQRIENGQNAIQSQLNGIGNGICDSTFALNNSIKDGFYSNAMATQQSKYEIGNGLSNLGFAMEQCCCTTNRNIDSVRYENAKNTCDIIAAGSANTQRIIDWLSCKELNDKNTKIYEQSQLLSEARIVASMKPQAPIPAYTVPSPYGQYSGYSPCCGC